jgi:nucleoside-diphosphate-sugar epimerase
VGLVDGGSGIASGGAAAALDVPAAEAGVSLVLVTGATGFVGQGLIARLERTGRPFRRALRDASGLSGAVQIADIGPDTDWTRALEGVDAVVHLAGRAHVVARDPGALSEFDRVNAGGTARLAEQAARAGVRRFVLISSVKAAADSSGDRALVETEPPVPGTPYGISKLKGEQALRELVGAMETVVLRPPLVHGPGVKANFLALLRLIDSGVPLPLASVRNRRSLIARDNLVDAIVTTLDAPAVAGGVYYVTDGPALSTPGLIRALAEALGKPARLIPFPPAALSFGARAIGRADSADSLLGSLALDDTAFRTATGWTPPVSQDAAFREIAVWYQRMKGPR